MTTQSVRFRFSFPQNPSSQEIHFHHDAPQAILALPPPNPTEALKFGRLFSSTIKSVAHQHESACLSRCGSKCMTCDKRCRKFAPIPIEICRDRKNTWIRMAVHPLCDAWECLYEAEKDLINGRSGGMSERSSSPQPLACKVCGTITGAKRCSGCKDVAYCGQDHQRKDWKVHKKTCVRKNGDDAIHDDSTQVIPVGEGSDEDDWVSTDEESYEEDGIHSDIDNSFTSSAVFNVARPSEPPRHVELSKE